MRRLLALALGALALAGCGGAFDLPTETREGRTFSTDHSYQMDLTWTNMDGIADILLTQGTGSQLFLLFKHDGVGLAPRGTVLGYALRAQPPTPAPLHGIEFHQLFVPAALCGAKGRVFVLDEGDTCLARANPGTGQCGDTTGGWRGDISDLNSYWHVRKYGLLGKDPLSTFTDTSMAFVRGIAADDQGRLYVSGSAIRYTPSRTDPRIKTRELVFRIVRYRRINAGETPDPYMPGASGWIRDQSFEVEEGSGIGSLIDPHGIYWAGGNVPGGPAIFAADFRKNWVQKLSDATSSLGYFRIDIAQDTTLEGPEDVAADLSGYLYIADTGNHRVLRFDPYGQFVQRVNVEPDAQGLALQQPVAVAADDSLVYVGDRALGRVIRYRRRK